MSNLNKIIGIDCNAYKARTKFEVLNLQLKILKFYRNLKCLFKSINCLENKK